jgi:cyanophycinase
VELPLYRRRDAGSVVLWARGGVGGFFYLTGGDPGLVANTRAGTLVWRTVVDRWAAGAPVAGSSAGAMALCQHTLVMAKWPRHDQRRPVDALGLVPATAVLPHFDTFGHRWTVTSEPSGVVQLGLDERTAAVWDGAAWRAAGAGAVTVIAGGRSRRFEAGQACEGIPAPIEPSPEGAR